jgi:para-aminobenzoate synthetase/4-amino-4-deoxychorismate lyase
VDSFALLDDRDGQSRLYTGLLECLDCPTPAALGSALAAMQSGLLSGRHAVALFSYELGAAMQGIAPRPDASAPSQILMYAHCALLDAQEVDAWLLCDAGPAGITGVRNSVDAATFDAAIARIHAYIEAGDTYQINYTYRLHFQAFGGIHALYGRLRQRQPVPYGALIALPDGGAVLSLSPELFVRHAAGRLTARPMKGTAQAGSDPAKAAADLAADAKNRAENLMIVDLLRNDLGRIARLGSVQVPALFEVSRFAEVLQMTSTVTADLREDVELAELFAALYPCGSITGAPKRRTMQIIRELEGDARGYYTGAIGWFEPPDATRKVGDFCLSVPIRTLTLQAPDTLGVRSAQMGVGAGIVHDSVAAEEYAECALKARFLTGLSNDFELFETMHAERSAGVRYLDLHLRRLGVSAHYFGFAFDEPALRTAVAAKCAQMIAGQSYRLRLGLKQDGGVTLKSAVLQPLIAPRVVLAAQPARVPALFLRHKTSLRADYDAGWQAAEKQGAFDSLFLNAQGELTEGGRSNIFLKLDGGWYTPPLSAGVLPGVMRSVLLNDPAWQAQERCLTQDDLRHAQDIVVCNSLRGAIHVAVDWTV